MEWTWLVAMAALAAAPRSAEEVAAAYRRAEEAVAPETVRLIGRLNVDPRWLPDGTCWYRVEAPNGREFVLVDPAGPRRGPAFDHAAVAAALSAVSGQRYTAGRLPFDELQRLPAGQLLLGAGERWWQWDPAARTLVAASAPKATPAARPAGRPQPRGDRSPDGRWQVANDGPNLLLRPTGGGEPRRLTDDGTKEASWFALSWSPDSQHLVVARSTRGADLPMTRLESVPADSYRPKVHTAVYPLPGDPVAQHTLAVIHLADGQRQMLAAESIDYEGRPALFWRRDGRHFLYERRWRGYQRAAVIEGDAVTGATRLVIDERSKTFVAPMKHHCQFLRDGDEILWMAERDGWNHLYLVNVDSGQARQLTRGEWVVRSVEAVDEAARTILLTAGGREPGDPYLKHWYRLHLDSGELVQLTPADGNHEISFSPDGQYLLDRSSRIDLPPVTALRRSRDGSLVLPLEQADLSAWQRAGWSVPEPFVAPGRDGRTPIYGVVWRPRNLDPSRKYPVVERIYAGPQGFFVPHGFTASDELQAVAELGLIAVQIDGMGTSGRSKAFHDVAWQNLADSGFPDRIAWLRALAAKYPYVDATTVGIFGGSAGGYNAARAVIDHPEVYRAAVANSGNHDHRTDKLWWNECWMGYPVGDHYRQQSNIECAARVGGALFLIHGDLDDNVYPAASTLRFAKALMEANKDFDLLYVPGGGHGVGGPYITRRMYDFWLRHLLGETPPHEYRLRAGSGASVNITIVNRTKATLSISWVSGDGTRRKYHDLAPGKELVQHTFVGHSWLAEDGDRVVGRYTAAEDQLRWEIGAVE
ncbi:MAG: prolyl oligopeptidase family serine peptidase [Fimbriimonadaceae bacterium]|nr:prolyl oligopeptidase family serine peptidase [Fimbriimonadaceae bacterium]